MSETQDTRPDPAEPEDDGLSAVPEYLRLSFDFTAYKPGTLNRRLRRRMEPLGIEDYARFALKCREEPAV